MKTQPVQTGQGPLHKTGEHPPAPLFCFNMGWILCIITHAIYQSIGIQDKWLICAMFVKMRCILLARKWDSLTKCASGIWFWYSLILQQPLSLLGQMSFWLLNLNRNYEEAASVHVLTWISVTLPIWATVSSYSGREERQHIYSHAVRHRGWNANIPVGHTLLNIKMEDRLKHWISQLCIFSCFELKRSIL